MAEKNQNIFKVEGTVFSKPIRRITSKKDDKEYEFKSIILELKREHKGKSYIDLPEFQLGLGVVDSGFEVGDYVQLTFSLVGKKINENWYKTELKALYIKHPDLDGGNDTRDLSGNAIYPKRQTDVFNAPNIYDNEPDDEIPF